MREKLYRIKNVDMAAFQLAPEELRHRCQLKPFDGSIFQVLKEVDLSRLKGLVEYLLAVQQENAKLMGAWTPSGDVAFAELTNTTMHGWIAAIDTLLGEENGDAVG
ncbi:MAG: hypothetical protein JRE40_04170 [Deltaproteobacteria bacterium]|nr:hypothetical protein [Deltaproteobacteria bacterium]